MLTDQVAVSVCIPMCIMNIFNQSGSMWRQINGNELFNNKSQNHGVH